MSLWRWAQFYRSIYEMLPTDKPDDTIIEDDAKLDAWYKQFTREMAARAAKAKSAQNPHSQRGRGRPLNDDQLPKLSDFLK